MRTWFLSMMLFSTSLFAQTLVNAYNFPYYNPYNYLWGITHQNDVLWMGTDYDNSATYPVTKLFKVSKTGQVLDSLSTPFKFNHGVAWDGSSFWIAEDYRSSGARIYKISTTGVKLDSINVPGLIGGSSGGIGDIEISGNNLWFSVYSPDFTSYPFSYAYCMNMVTRLITDTIPLRGKQVYGISVKGDTVFYVTDNFQGDQERVYAYRKAVGDTIFSFTLPDPDGDNNPKSLHWDGEYLWLVADRVGGLASAYKALYKYSLGGSGTPILQTSSSVAFGDVTIGLPQERQLVVYNQGTGTLSIDSLKLNNQYFTISPSNVPHSIPPGEQKIYQVQFSPQNSSVQNGLLMIYSNDVTTPVKSVTLTGHGVYGLPYISLSSDSLMFGRRRKGSLSSRTLTVTNIGGGQLRIDSVRFNTQYFALNNQSMPVIIDSTQSKIIRVWFTPDAVSFFSDSLTLYSNASNITISRLFISGSGVPNDSTLGAIIWEGTIPENPATSYQDLSARQIKKINDLNGDGKEDLIVTTDNYLTIAYSGNSSVASEVLWSFNTAQSNVNTGNVERMQCLRVESDLNNDGCNDVVIGTWGGGESVIAINGKNGIKLWEFGDSINYDTGDIMGIDVKRDWNSDGKPDVLATASGNENTGNGRYSVFCLNGINGEIIWQINEASAAKMKYGVISTDDGGAYGSRVAGVTAGEVRGFSKTGQVTWTYPTASAPWALVEIPNIGGNPGSDVVFGDISGHVTCVDGKDGQLLWTKSIGSAFIEDLFLTNDVNSSGKKDILVSALVPPLYLLEGLNGNILISPNTGGNVLGAGELGDIDGDGKNDVAAANLSNYLRIFSPATGIELFNFQPHSSGSGNAVESVWRLGDIDANGKDEFVIGTRDGHVIAMHSGPVNTSLPYITITAPNGGEVWSAGSQKNITGTSNAMQVPAIASTNIFIKVSDAGSSGIFDLSDAPFTITTQNNVATIQLITGWNLVAMPLTLTNMTPVSVFPLATSSVFGFNNGYFSVDTLKNQKGYWVRYASPAGITITGGIPTLTTIPVQTGWNMIGINNVNVPISGITSTPPGILNSQFFAFDNGYVTPPSMLESTRGYWIRSSQPGVINLPTAAAAKDKPVLAGKKISAVSSIEVKDASGNKQVLYFTETPEKFNELPPLPPQGVFDCRFDNNTFTSSIQSGKQSLRMSGIIYPAVITISGMPLLLEDASTKGKLVHVQLADGEKYVLTNTNILALDVTPVIAPMEFSLSQNFPNPFNPETEIRFALPVKGNVRLEVYNPIGELVTTLVNRE
ncbi:MAG: choice-of-anchor D domain-containing protein, partial [Ignavibacteriales bacterium]|nr:choice-of-anchor D domain-containing protein [Ignavibacteriales bacterium]